MRRVLLKGWCVSLLLTVPIIVLNTSPGDAQSPVITSHPGILPAGPDFATDALGDPWDFSNPEDLSPFPDEFPGWTISGSEARRTGRAAFLSGGAFVGRTTTGGGNLVPLLYRGGSNFITSSLETSGTFDHKAIPTGRYGKLAVAMTLGASTSGQLAAFWYSAAYGTPGERARGVAFRFPQAGTRLYLVDLATGVWHDDRGNPSTASFLPVGDFGAVAWNDVHLMRGLQLRPTSDGNAQVDVHIDWVRLTQRDGGAGAAIAPITFSGCSSRDYNVEVQVSSSRWEIIHTGTSGAGSTTTANVNYGVLAPGTWQFRVSCYPSSRAPTGGAAVSSPPVAITINSPPLVRVHNPDAVGGPDFAATVLGNAWDMDGMRDIAQFFNVTGAHITSDGVTNALQATGTSNGDPIVVLLNGAAAIDTSRYRNLTFALTLDTPFGLNGAAGEGSVARVIWGRPNGVTVSQDILVWPGRNVYNVDLAPLATNNGGLETECVPGCQQLPWTDGPIPHFRIDPHESTRNVTFRLGSVLLTAHDEVATGGAFAIQYSFSDPDGGGGPYHARIYLDSDREASTKALIETITSGVTPNTVLHYAFHPASKGVPPGDYFVLVEISEARSGVTDSRGVYSSGPIRVFAGGGLAPPGPPSLQAVHTASNPITLSWSQGTGSPPTSYTISAGTSPGATNLGVFNVGLQTQITGNAPVGIPLHVRVTAANGAGAANSNEISFVVGSGTVPPGRPSMNPPSISGRTVSLSWNPPASGGTPTHYILVGRFSGNPAIIAQLPLAANAISIPGVAPGSYVVTVVAVNAAGMSPESGGVVVNVQ